MKIKKTCMALLTAAVVMANMMQPVFAYARSDFAGDLEPARAVDTRAQEPQYVHVNGSISEGLTITDGGEIFSAYCFNGNLLGPDENISYIQVAWDEQNAALLQKLRKALFAGYPINGLGFYSLGEVQYQFSLDDFLSLLVITRDINALLPQYEEGAKVTASNALAFANDVFCSENAVTLRATPIFHAAMCIINSDSLEAAATLYGVRYIKTQGTVLTGTEAFSATQQVIWTVLRENGVADNNKGSIETALEKLIYDYVQSAAKLPAADADALFAVSGEAIFHYDNDSGQYMTGNLSIHGDGIFTLVNLPEGMRIAGSGGNTVTAGQYFQLISQQDPRIYGGELTIHSEAAAAPADIRLYVPQGVSNVQKLIGFNTSGVTGIGTLSYTVEDTSNVPENGPEMPGYENGGSSAEQPSVGVILSSPKTGDNDDIMLYAALFAASLACLLHHVMAKKEEFITI